MTFCNSGRSVRQLLRCFKGSNTPTEFHSSTINRVSLIQEVSQAHTLGSISSSSCCCRAYSDYAATGRGTAGSGLRRVNPSTSTANGSSSAEATASTSGQAGSSASLLEMKEVPGGSKPLRRWEYYYWGLGATGISFLLYNRLKKPDKTPEEIEEAERKAEELRGRRKEHVRAVLMSQNFLEGDDDPLDGLTPAQIVLFCEKYGIDPSDPLEGLTPEEIDAYMAQQEAKREQQQAA